MVGVTKIQRGNAGYWLAAVAEGGDDYYTKPGEAPGEWIGDLAADLALAGEVDAASYSQILEGTDPISGSQLLKRPDTRYRQRPDGTEKRIEPVLGYDVRFSAPKSVSILYALGDEATRERVVAILNDAVREGVAHLEQNACYVQRGEGGKELERGTGFVGMAFRHRMSRAGDPALQRGRRSAHDHGRPQLAGGVGHCGAGGKAGDACRGGLVEDVVADQLPEYAIKRAMEHLRREHGGLGMHGVLVARQPAVGDPRLDRAGDDQYRVRTGARRGRRRVLRADGRNDHQARKGGGRAEHALGKDDDGD